MNNPFFNNKSVRPNQSYADIKQATMVETIKPKDILVNEEVKSFYEKQEELINEIRESIRINGLRNPLVINQKNILMDGYVRLNVLLESGKGDEEIDVIVVDQESTIEDYILRNSGRTKTDNDLVKEWKYIFFKKYQKRQGRKKNGEPEGTYAENVSRALGGRFKDDETINKIGFCLKNDLPGNIISKGIIKDTISPDNGKEFLKTYHPIDIEKNYGFTEKVIAGELNVQDAIKLIKSMDDLDETYKGSFVIPDKCYSYNINCVEIENIEKHRGTVDLGFSSVFYYFLRKYDVGNNEQPGHEDSKEEYCQVIARIINKIKITLKESGSLMINIGDTYINRVAQGIPFMLIDYITKETGLIFNEMLVWSKKNPKGNGSADDKNRPTNNVEYILWFVVDPKKAKYRKLTYKTKDSKPSISKGHKDVDNKGNVAKKSVTLSKGYKKIYTHIEEQTIENIIKTSVGKNHDVYNILEDAHPAIMSPMLPVCPILMATDEGDTVFDFMSGSNVVGRVSQLLNRKTLSTELSEKYFKVGCKMLENAVQEFNRDDLDIINEVAYETVFETELIEAA
jgi:DNA modification methylase